MYWLLGVFCGAATLRMSSAPNRTLVDLMTQRLQPQPGERFCDCLPGTGGSG